MGKTLEFLFPRLGMLLHPTGSAPAPTWGCVGVPAGPEMGWDIPGASWAFMEENQELGRSEAELGLCQLCPSELCHGWDKTDLEMALAGHRGTRSHQGAVVGDTGSPWDGHPCPGMLLPCGMWPSGAGMC